MTQTPPTASAVVAWLGAWSHPPDRTAQIVLGLALGLLVLIAVPGGMGSLASALDFASVAHLARRRRFLTVASFVAAFMSLGYIAVYLRGGPRAADASTYWLEGRALSHASSVWTIGDPSASFRAAGLLFQAPDRLSGILPPGYPLLLAVGFVVGAPMLIGPLVAAALVVVTWMLAHEVVADSPARDDAPPGGVVDGMRAEKIARFAVGLSIVSAALRYHTADTLPYGACACAMALSLASALRAHRTGRVAFFGVAGVGLAFLVAAETTSALVVGAVVAALAWGAGRAARVRALAWVCAAALPGVLLILSVNRAGTGHALLYPSALYKALSGEDHALQGGALAGAAVQAAGSHGARYAVLLLQRLRQHASDVSNLELVALAAIVPLVRREGRGRTTLFVGFVVAAQLLLFLTVRPDVAAPAALGANAPPLISGPQVGALLVAHAADASPLIALLPLEHVLIAVGVARMFPHSLERAALVTLALSLLGFGVHASHVHAALAGGDLGRPRFEPDVAREANVTHGLLFFEDDAGFRLAYEPGMVASHGIAAARVLGDDHDRLLYDLLGHPPTHRYVATVANASAPSWTPPSVGGDTWRFETVNDWPPVSQERASTQTVASDVACAANETLVRVTPTGGGDAIVTFALPVPPGPSLGAKRSWVVVPRVVKRGAAGTASMTLVTDIGLGGLAQWSWSDSAPPAGCAELPAQRVEFEGDRLRAWLVVRANGGPVTLERTTLRTR